MKELSITDIKNILNNTSSEELDFVINRFSDDSRVGVKKLIASTKRKAEKLALELERIDKMHIYENEYKAYEYIAGVDEVGRGPLAGPVVTAAVILPKDIKILYVNDSKKLSKEKREELFQEIMDKAISTSIGIVSSEQIDSINILNATYRAMKEAVESLKVKPQVVLVDAVTIPDITVLQRGIIKGDEKSISIAAASIIAKVTRDQIMEGYDSIYPEYNFSKNKGYGTLEHINAIKRYGPSPIHRATFIKNFI